MKFKANPTEVDAYKITGILPAVNGVTTVSAEGLGNVDLTAVSMGKYEPGIGDYVIKDGDDTYLLPAHVFDERFSTTEQMTDEQVAAKTAEVKDKQDNAKDEIKEGDVHTFLDEKNKASAQ